MAKFNSPTLGPVSGSSAGQTYSRNRGGNYIRNRTKPVNPNTPQQVLIRGAFKTASSFWTNTLTAGDRAAWTTYAQANPILNALGNVIVLTGLQMWMLYGMPMAAYAPPLVVPTIPFNTPFMPAFDSTSTVTVSGSAGTIAWSIDWANDFAIGDIILIDITKGVSAGSTAAHAPRRVFSAVAVTSITGPLLNNQSGSGIPNPFGTGQVAGSPAMSKAYLIRPNANSPLNSPLQIASVVI